MEFKKIEFKLPLSESELQNLIRTSLIDLGLGGDWTFEHGYRLNDVIECSTNENVKGTIMSKYECVLEFKVGPYADGDYSKDPKFADIEIHGIYGSPKRDKFYNEYADKVCTSFLENYKKIKQEKN